MTVDLFACCWNEERLLPYFLKHYSFCRSITIFDNESDDRSVDIIQSFPNAKAVTYRTDGEYRDDVLLDIKNTCWKGSDADWVIVCDIDEFMFGDLSGVQETIVKPFAYTMCHPEFSLSEAVGWRDVTYDKPVAFRPKEVAINYLMGAHDCRPTGNVSFHHAPDFTLKHYKYLGISESVARHEAYRRRMGANKHKGAARYDLHPPHYVRDLIEDKWRRHQPNHQGQ